MIINVRAARVAGMTDAQIVAALLAQQREKDRKRKENSQKRRAKRYLVEMAQLALRRHR
jgi:hypothetical protein